ncbi:MAG: hypothetical protein S4CHLAM2_09700 [Chlamydiales bacterium]|nr:hypothetical protein [Chlamydiales bacterium]
MKKLFLVLLLLPLFLNIYGYQTGAQDSGLINRPFELADGSGTVRFYGELSGDEQYYLTVHDLITKYIYVRENQRARIERQLRPYGITVERTPSRKQPPSSEQVQKQPATLEKAHPPVTLDFLHRTEDGIIVRFHGTINSAYETQVMGLAQSYLKATHKKQRSNYRQELNRLGVQVEELN